MDDAREPSDATAGDEDRVVELPVLPSMSRRRFNTVVGAGSAAALGAGVLAPHISTIKFARKAAVGSPPPGSTTTTTIGGTGTTVPGKGGGNARISITNHAPCYGDVIGVVATGFAPKTAVSFEIDSPAHPLGVATCDSSGRVSTLVHFPAGGPTGVHRLVASGIQTGGKSLTLTTPMNIKAQGDCVDGTSKQGSKDPNSVDVSGSTGSTGSTNGGSTGSTNSGDGALPFTGTDSSRLAILGAGAAIIGRVLYGATQPRREGDATTPETPPGP